MSYILDALRRADSERERGDVPGLHTHPFPVNDADADAERRPRLWIGLVAASFVALLSAVAWLLMERSSTQDLAATPEHVASMAAAAIAAPPPTSATSATPAALAATDVASQAVAPPKPTAATDSPTVAAAQSGRSEAAGSKIDTPTRDRAAGSSARDARPAQERTARAVAPQKPTPKSTPKSTAQADTSSRETETRPRIYALRELPEEIRRALPATSVNGSVYSRSAASRMVVINGRVFHEGDELADQLVLEEIRQKSAVLRFKGFRYQIDYP